MGHTHSHTPQTIDALLDACRAAGMRRTMALRCFLEVLLEESRPMTLPEIAGHPRFGITCDPATLYRLAARLEEHRLIRQIGFHSRAAHYLLRGGAHQDYLICRDCGSIAVLDVECPVHELEKNIETTSGFSDIEHELEFYGTCRACRN